MSDYLIWYYDDADILPGYRSDHSLITLKLKFGKDTGHNTFWKFNTSLLRDTNYVSEINEEILNVIKEYVEGDLGVTNIYEMHVRNTLKDIRQIVFGFLAYEN